MNEDTLLEKAIQADRDDEDELIAAIESADDAEVDEDDDLSTAIVS